LGDSLLSGKIQGISADSARETVTRVCFPHHKSDGYGDIPYAKEQGIFLEITANFPSVSGNVHHDALEFPDGKTVLLTQLCKGQRATVLQLPAGIGIAVDDAQSNESNVASPVAARLVARAD
jgi:hypothetical protein